MTAKNPQRGFTLIELVIVIGILGILMGVLISVLNPAMYQKKARDAVRKNHILEIAKAAQAYYAETGSWPTSKAQLNPDSGEGYIKSWPGGDPVKAPNTYIVSASCGANKFCVHVGEEVTSGSFIFWYSEVGKIQESAGGCDSSAVCSP